MIDSNSTEQEIFTDKNVRVTNARIIIGGTTYALRNITSVKVASTPPKKGGANKLFFFSALGFIGGLVWFFVGGDPRTPSLILIAASAIFAVLSILWSRSLKTMYHLMVTSSSQEVDALSSFDKDYISIIVEKINEAIVKCR